MKIGVRQLRDETTSVVEAVAAGETVVLTVRGDRWPTSTCTVVADAWLSGPALDAELAARAADPGLRDDLARLAGETLADL